MSKQRGQARQVLHLLLLFAMCFGMAIGIKGQAQVLFEYDIPAKVLVSPDSQTNSATQTSSTTQANTAIQANANTQTDSLSQAVPLVTSQAEYGSKADADSAHGFSLASIQADTVWQLSGVNLSTEPKLIIIQIGTKNASYAQRINQERGVLPGPFAFRFYPSAYLASKGKPLNFDLALNVTIFTTEAEPLIQDFRLTPLSPSPLDTFYAFDLGPESQTLWQGFDAMTPSHPFLAHITAQNDKALVPFDRLSVDPLIRDGISGITSLHLPLPEGKWRLHLWMEDVGYWQTLPEKIERRIRINGQDRDYQLTPPWQWVAGRYTQNKFRLSQIAELNNVTPWRAIGQYRGDHQTYEVESQGGKVSIELAGANKIATSISALVVERIEQRSLAEINYQRALWFNGRWPLLPNQPLSISSEPSSEPISAKRIPYRISRNAPLFVSLPLTQAISLGQITLKTPLAWEKRLSHPQLERSMADQSANPAGSFLAIKPILLSAANQMSHQTSRLHLTFKAPANLPAGDYPVEVRHQQNQALLASFTIQLIDLHLPELTKPVGVYLDQAPHLFLSYERKNMAAKQQYCDLNTLASLSLTGVAPHFPLLKDADQQSAYQSRLSNLLSLGFHPPFVDYAGLKNLRFQFGQDETQQKLAALAKGAQTYPKSLIAMSIADEPSNASSHGFALTQLAKLVDQGNQGASSPLLKAAHLNHPKDRRLLKEIDIALINQGYGINRQSIDHIRQKGAEAWLYNMSNKRLAAGFFLWKHQLSGYLQWHARMPTADPFDPTDGREDDQQLLPVMPTLCPEVADIHPHLIDIAEGITDHKWLIWLEQISQTSVAGDTLRQQLRHKIPNTWQRAEKITSKELQTWRNDIEELALSILNKN